MDPQKQHNDRALSVPQRQTVHSVRTSDRDAAAEVMRSQIDRIYDDHDISPDADTHEKQVNSPYQQTHSETTDHRLSEQQAQHQWQQYHSQWQSYYQQYYERYYVGQIAKRQRELAGHQVPAEASPIMVTAGEPEVTTTQNQAVSELRNQLLDRVKEQSKKVRASKHFVPILAALIVALTFIFLQYNSLIFAQVRAYVSPGSINPANLVIDPTTDTKVGPEPKIIIPKINVEYAVDYDLNTLQESVVQTKLKKGVVHYPIPGASAFPGEKGNTVILGHSSNDVFDDGIAKFAFVQLNNLEKGDTFYLNYKGTRYTYSVTDKKVIKPTQVSELVIGNDKPMATLVTCDPPGTALNRLVVFAEQISPDPDQAAASTQASSSSDSTDVALPGNSPTLFQRLFGQ